MPEWTQNVFPSTRNKGKTESESMKNTGKSNSNFIIFTEIPITDWKNWD